jgi:hypothetical protein
MVWGGGTEKGAADQESAAEIIRALARLAADGHFPEVCLEAGIFLEQFVTEINLRCLLGFPRDFKTGVDSLIERQTISRPLGYKLHVVRELRNVKAHQLPYLITISDAWIAVHAVNQLVAWNHLERPGAEWTTLSNRFEEAYRVLSSESSTASDSTNAMMTLAETLNNAAVLKAESLDRKPGNRFELWSAVALLAKRGLPVRSGAWGKLASHYAEVRHGRPANPNAIKPLLPKLRQTLQTLIPDARGSRPEYPQLTWAPESGKIEIVWVGEASSPTGGTEGA